MNREEVGVRLRKARENIGLSRDAVIALPEIDISRTTLQQWELGQTEASLEKLSVLSELYKVSPQYLIFGDTKAETPPDEDYAYIPVYDIEVSAGHGAFSEGAAAPEKRLAFRRRWLDARGLDGARLSAVFTRGDSMAPTIPDGAAIVVDHRRNSAMDGKIYVIRIDNRLWVKRTQWLIDGGLRLISDNQIYQPLDITSNDLNIDNNIEIIGQVVHVAYDLPD